MDTYNVDCWDVLENRHIWKYRCESSDLHVLDFATHVVENGKVVVILIGESTNFILETCAYLAFFGENEYSFSGSSVKIFRLDLLTGTSCSLYNFDIPWCARHEFQVMMCENIAVIVNPCKRIILVNWKLQACILSSIPQSLYPGQVR